MKSFIKRGMSGLLAFLMCFTALFGAGSTTAFAASETSESYMISFPRDGDANQVYGTDTWGHPAKNFMNGWYTEENTTWTVHAQESFEGQVCYCIEPGVHREIGDTYSGFGENFWDNYPSSYNNTIEPDTIKVLLGRIMQYGRFFKLYMYTAIAPIPLSSFAGEPTQSIGKSFLKSYAAVCLEGAIIVLACIIFSIFAGSPPVVDPDAAAATMVWSYIGELIFNMLILVGSVKMSDRIVREMMGL